MTAETEAFARGMALAGGEPVDLAGARLAFRAAAEAGDVRGALVYAGFLSGGIGGPRRWREAVDLLRQWCDRDAFAAAQVDLIARMDLDPEGRPLATPPPRSLHPGKTVSLVPGFLSGAECALVVAMTAGRFRPARIASGTDSVGRQPAIRDNDVASFNPLEESPFLRAVNARIAAATGTDVRQGEPIQILRYSRGQQFRPHVDRVVGGANKRVLTAIVYLNDDYSGGETNFVRLGLAVRGRRGDMLVFRSLDDQGQVDRDMLHAGAPVTAGTKFVASRWILERPAYDSQGMLIGPTLWS